MPHIKLSILSLIIASVTSLAVVATASATPEFFVEGKALSAAMEIEGTSSDSELKSEIGSVKITIACTGDTIDGSIEAAGASHATIELVGCSLEGLSGCEIAEPITAKVLDRLIEVEGKVEDEFYQEGSSPFATVKISKCPLKGSFELTGTQICELPGGEEVTVEHEIKCAASGSKLKLGSKSATFEDTETIKLTSGEKFDDSTLYYVTVAPARLVIPAVNGRGTVTITNVGLDSAEVAEEKLVGAGANKYRIAAACAGVLIDHGQNCQATIERTAAGNQAAEYQAKIRWPLESGSITFGVDLEE